MGWKILGTLFVLSIVAHAIDDKCIAALTANPNAGELRRYEQARILGLGPTADINAFQPAAGIIVTHRDNDGNAAEGRIRVLVDNPWSQIYVLSEANGWGTRLTDEDKLHPIPDTPYYEGKFRGLRHAIEYRLLVNGQQLLDPVADTFTTGTYLNSVFWDFDRPGAYRMTAPPVDLRGRFVMLAETGIRELCARWEYQGHLGPRRREDTYRFIAESGLAQELARRGYNAVEFLPFNASVDGDAWHLRYQVYGLYGPDARDGSPDDFARMVDAFHHAGVAVIQDAVIGHYPWGGNSGLRDLHAVGLHQWKKGSGGNLYGQWPSPWHTNRYDYANPFVRRFLTESILYGMKRYRLSGLRVDNLDGIRFYDGPGGGGETFVREMTAAIRAYRPDALLIGEMFFGHNPVLAAMDRGGMGFNLRTHSDLFDFFKDNLQKRTEEIQLWRLRNAIRDPWGWGEAMRLQYVTNHDEAANRRDGATGAYPASLLNGGGWNYVEWKTKAYGSVAMLSGTSYMDMPQMRLLQEGTFQTNPTIDWGLLKLGSQAAIDRYFTDLSRYVVARPAFAFPNLHPNVENHVDEGNKVTSFLRLDFATGKRTYVLVSLSHRAFAGYNFGVDSAAGSSLRVAIDSDRSDYAGSGRLAREAAKSTLTVEAKGNHGKSRSVTVPYLAPYGVVVLEEP